jgi:hypothetical protein
MAFSPNTECAYVSSHIELLRGGDTSSVHRSCVHSLSLMHKTHMSSLTFVPLSFLTLSRLSFATADILFSTRFFVVIKMHLRSHTSLLSPYPLVSFPFVHQLNLSASQRLSMFSSYVIAVLAFPSN